MDDGLASKSCCVVSLVEELYHPFSLHPGVQMGASEPLGNPSKMLGLFLQ